MSHQRIHQPCSNYLIRKASRSDSGPEGDTSLEGDDRDVVLKRLSRVRLVRHETRDADVLGRDAVTRRRDVMVAESDMRRRRRDPDEAVRRAQHVTI